MGAIVVCEVRNESQYKVVCQTDAWVIWTHMPHADTLASVMEISGITREAALELLEAHLPDCTPEACGRVSLRVAIEDFEREGINHVVRAVLIDGLESVEPTASSGSSIAFRIQHCLHQLLEPLLRGIWVNSETHVYHGRRQIS